MTAHFDFEHRRADAVCFHSLIFLLYHFSIFDFFTFILYGSIRSMGTCDL